MHSLELPNLVRKRRSTTQLGRENSKTTKYQQTTAGQQATADQQKKEDQQTTGQIKETKQPGVMVSNEDEGEDIEDYLEQFKSIYMSTKFMGRKQEHTYVSKPPTKRVRSYCCSCNDYLGVGRHKCGKCGHEKCPECLVEGTK